MRVRSQATSLVLLAGTAAARLSPNPKQKRRTLQDLTSHLHHYNDIGGLSFGEHHNLALEYYRNEARMHGVGTTLDEIVDAVEEYAVQANLIGAGDVQEIKEQIISKLGGGPENVAEVALHPGSAFDDALLDLNDISHNGADAMDQIEQSIALIEDAIVPLADAGDVQAQNFVDVYKSSLEYWTLTWHQRRLTLLSVHDNPMGGFGFDEPFPYRDPFQGAFRSPFGFGDPFNPWGNPFDDQPPQTTTQPPPPATTVNPNNPFAPLVDFFLIDAGCTSAVNSDESPWLTGAAIVFGVICSAVRARGSGGGGSRD